MKQLEKIAVLIDCDNTPAYTMEGILQELSKLGNIVLKRAYGNWKKDTHKIWETELMRFGIKAEQQFDYVSGKNATDIALVIDAMTLLHKNLYDGFVLVSSDSDYTPLAIHLRESGAYVIGAGKKHSPDAFQNSCNTFLFLENLETAAAPVPGPALHENLSTPPCELSGKDNLNRIHAVLKEAWEKHHNKTGYAATCTAGQALVSAFGTFHIKSYGYPNLTTLLESFPEKYRLKTFPGKGSSTIRSYRCIEASADKPQTAKATAQYEAIVEYLTVHHRAKRAEFDKLLSLKSSRTGSIVKAMMDSGILIAEGPRNNRIYKLNR